MVGLSPISFTFLKISVAKLVTYFDITVYGFYSAGVFYVFRRLPDQKTLIIAKVIYDLDTANKMRIIIKILSLFLHVQLGGYYDDNAKQ